MVPAVDDEEEYEAPTRLYQPTSRRRRDEDEVMGALLARRPVPKPVRALPPASGSHSIAPAVMQTSLRLRFGCPPPR